MRRFSSRLDPACGAGERTNPGCGTSSHVPTHAMRTLFAAVSGSSSQRPRQALSVRRSRFSYRRFGAFIRKRPCMRRPGSVSRDLERSVHGAALTSCQDAALLFLRWEERLINAVTSKVRMSSGFTISPCTPGVLQRQSIGVGQLRWSDEEEFPPKPVHCSWVTS
jgi:hypothetical protein